MDEKGKPGRLRVRNGMRRVMAGAFLLLLGVPAASAQQQPPAESKDSSAPSAPQPAAGVAPADQQNAPATPQAPKPTTPPAPYVHSFWDRENDWLFAGVAAGRAFDYASTLNLRRRGINEVFLTNSIVDDHPLFASIEAAATGASIGVSYIFHATGHHRLERWTSIIHFGVATGGAIRNYALKTPHG
jgi:pyruvate/2-oxoglutarate dehydrogenase complex dihydrolipoamide acyltransferase (E2) component